MQLCSMFCVFHYKYVTCRGFPWCSLTIRNWWPQGDMQCNYVSRRSVQPRKYPGVDWNIRGSKKNVRGWKKTQRLEDNLRGWKKTLVPERLKQNSERLEKNRRGWEKPLLIFIYVFICISVIISLHWSFGTTGSFLLSVPCPLFDGQKLYDRSPWPNFGPDPPYNQSAWPNFGPDPPYDLSAWPNVGPDPPYVRSVRLAQFWPRSTCRPDPPCAQFWPRSTCHPDTPCAQIHPAQLEQIHLS